MGGKKRDPNDPKKNLWIYRFSSPPLGEWEKIARVSLTLQTSIPKRPPVGTAWENASPDDRAR